ncbi:YsnF/AvaK domain-containing protein [Dyadobacter crusticola]|uniref:YsnF/AvaK domain-containing protein n=1 Tax=Dyadobacter crusticola TaxID=292407 RepID=UPI0005548EBA|nr:YsnF/AvaK domain-containing protein [Dyadobacter crusticola]
MAKTVVGIFEYESDAQQAQNYLLANGFADGDVDIKTASYTSDSSAATVNQDNDMMDRVGNFFRDLFDGDDEEIKRYSEAGRRGTIVTVHATDAVEAEAAAAILDQYGAIDIDGSSENYLDDNAGINTPATAYIDPVVPAYQDTPVTTYTESNVDTFENRALDVTPDELRLTDESLVSDERSESLPVIEEQLQVGKREIETGGVRLRSRIVERPVQESIRLRQEQVSINRTPVDRLASESELDTFREGTIEMKEYAEIPVISKEARVVEEVSLNKTVDERNEVIHETLRNTEVEAEDLTDEERLRGSGLDL